jgi:hypothetical protein
MSEPIPSGQNQQLTTKLFPCYFVSSLKTDENKHKTQKKQNML